MKRTALFFVVAALVLAFAMPNLASAKKKKKHKKRTVEICHALDLWDVPHNEWTVMVGEIKTIKRSKLKKHLKHGDTTVINDINYGPVIYGLTWLQIATNLEMDTEGANCAAFIPDLD